MSKGTFGAGTELGGYRIESLLGRGGMGVVYRAHDLALERSVALKLLAPELAEDVRFRERFHRESRLAASLDHPSIVPIYDAGEVAGQLYIAMRLVEGTDLKRLLVDEGPLESERALAFLTQVADALDAAHERGLVHRDVKPSNVLVDSRGHVYLADFGLSRRIEDSTVRPGEERSLGTVAYVAPEQIRGDELDGRADLYSLGCMLYECLAGRPPFAGSDTAVVFAHLQEEPPVLTDLGSVVTKALAKDPDDRYQSGRELIDAAREALGLIKSRRSRLAPMFIGVAVALAGAVVLGFILTRGGSGVQAAPGADSLVRIDPKSNAVTSKMPVGRKASGVAAAGRYVWVTSFAGGTVWRVDARTQRVLEIPVSGSPTGVAADDGQVLVANGPEHDLVSIDPSTGAVNFITPLAGDSVGSAQVATGVSAGMRFADAAQGVIGEVGITVKGNPPVDPIPIPPAETNYVSAYQSFDGIAVDDSVWVAGDTFDREIFRSDPGTGERLIHSIRIPFAPGSMAAGEGSVWVSSLLGDAVWQIDSVTGALGARVAVPGGVAGIVVADGSAWIASSTKPVVSRINPRTNRIVARIPTVGTPTSIAAGAGGIWVTTTKPPAAVSPGTVRIGLIADCQGPYANSYDQSIGGASLPLLHNGGRRAGPNVADGVVGAHVAGKPVELAFGCTDGTATSALIEARRLVEQVGVRVLIGPTGASEEMALQEYARRQPGVAFVNGSAGAQLLSPPPNFFSFHIDLAGSMAGLGTYAYRTLGWRRAVTVVDLADPAVNWAQAAGFAAEFCSLGGKVVTQVAVPRGTQDYSSIVAQIPRNGVDGIVAAVSPQTAVALAADYPGLRGDVSKKLILGALAFPPPADIAYGMVSGVSWLTEGEKGYRYGVDLGSHFPGLFDQLGPFDISYRDAMTATLQALSAVGGDLSGGERRFMAALRRLTLDSPLGRIRLDQSRQAVGRNFLMHFPDRTIVRRVDGVEHTFGGYFKPTDPPPGPATPVCKRRAPPPWAR